MFAEYLRNAKSVLCALQPAQTSSEVCLRNKKHYDIEISSGLSLLGISQLLVLSVHDTRQNVEPAMSNSLYSSLCGNF